MFVPFGTIGKVRVSEDGGQGFNGSAGLGGWRRKLGFENANRFQKKVYTFVSEENAFSSIRYAEFMLTFVYPERKVVFNEIKDLA